MKVHILERILFLVIACTVIFIGLILYRYLVSIYQSHWPLVPAFQSHTSFVLSAGTAGDPETSRFLLYLQDRHASGIMYFDQPASASAAAAAAVIKVKVDAEALRAETRSICALRPSRIGVFAVVPGHECSARDDITLKIVTVWLPGPRAAKAPVPQSQRVIGDSPARASAFGGQLSMPVMNAPIEMDTINTPHRCVRGKCNGEPLSEPAAAAVPNITAGISTYINNNEPPFGIILATTHAQIIRIIYPSESKSDGFCRVGAHPLISNPLVIGFFEQEPGKTLDLGVSSTRSGCDLGTAPLHCIWGPFESMTTTIRPSVNAEIGIEEPTGKSSFDMASA